MSDRLKELLVLLATDEDVAGAFARDPVELVERFELGAADVAALRRLRVEGRASAPRRLEERLSRSGMGFAATLYDASASTDPGPDDGGGSGSGRSDDGGSHGSSRHSSGEPTREPDDGSQGKHDDGSQEEDGGRATGSRGDGAPTTPATPAASASALAVPAVPAAESTPAVPAPEPIGDGSGAAPTMSGPDAAVPREEPARGPDGAADDLWHALDDRGGDHHDGGDTAPGPSSAAAPSGAPLVVEPVPSPQWGQFGAAATVPAGAGIAPTTAMSGAPPAPIGHPGPAGAEGDHDPRGGAERFRNSLLDAAADAADVDAGHGHPPGHPGDDPFPDGRGHDHPRPALPAVDALADLIVDIARGETPGGTPAPGLQAAALHVLDVLGVDLDGSGRTEPPHVSSSPTPDGPAAVVSGATGSGADAAVEARGGPAVDEPGPTDTVRAEQHRGADADADAGAVAGADSGAGAGEPAVVPDPAVAAVVPPPRAEAPVSGPAGSYRGGVVAEQGLPGPDDRLRVTYADGSQRDVVRSIADGKATDTYTTADGVTTTETHGPDGGWTTSEPDGTTTVATRTGGILTEEVHDPDGTVSTTRASLFGRFSEMRVLEGQEQFSTTTTGPDGSVIGVRVVGTADGGAVAITSDPPATATTRVDLDDVDNPDGTVTRAFTFPDGRTEAFTVNAVGDVVAHEVHETGGRHHPAALPDTGYGGGIVLEVDRDSAGTPGLVEQHLADGTVREVVRTPDVDGGHTDAWTEPDGTTVMASSSGFTTTTAPDGAVITLEHDAWQATRTVTAPDGTAGTATASGFAPDTEILRTRAGTPPVETSVVLDADGRGARATITTPTGIEHAQVQITDVPNPDGSTTHLLVFPDGRTEVLTTDVGGGAVALESRPGTGEPADPPGDPAAEAAGSYHGGVWREETTTDPATGAEVVTRTYADGAVVEVGPDGSYALPDGSRVTERVWSDGVSGMTTTEAPDGTVTEESFDPTSFTSGVTRPDGSSSSVIWGGPSGGALFETVDTDPAGGQTITSVAPLDDGGGLATITRGGTSVTVRVAIDEVTNVDGTTTRIHTFPDGRTEAFAVDALGVAVHHESHPGSGSPVGEPGSSDGSSSAALRLPADGYRGGVVGEKVLVEQGAPGGPVEVPVLDADGAPTGIVRYEDAGPATPATVEILRADGTTQEIQRYTAPDGEVHESWVAPDGTRVTTHEDTGDGVRGSSTEVGADGSSTLRAWSAQEGFAEDRTDLDGTTTRFRIPLDGAVPPAGGEIFSTVRVAATGQTVTTSVITTADGGAAAVAVRSDGVSVTARLDVTEVANLDGSTTRVYTFPDGRTESVTVDGRTGQVLAHESVPADGPAAPPASAVTGPVPTEVTVEPDGDRVEVRTHADGTVETVTTAPTGTWVSEATDPGGTTLRTEVADDGSLVKTVTLADGSSTEVTRSPGTLVVTATAVDGVVATNAVDEDGRSESSVYHPATGTWTVKVHEADGTLSRTELTADHTSTTVALAPDGTQTRTVVDAEGQREVGTLLPDGTVRIETDLDGRHIVAEHRTDGVATQTETVPTAGGGTSTSTVTEHPDGLIEQRTDDGAGTTEALTTRPDGTWSRVTATPDGAVVEESLTADRRITVLTTLPGDQGWTRVELSEDGSRIDTARDAEGFETRREVAPDGTWHATLDNRDGITEVWRNDDGSQRTRLTTPNGDWTQVEHFTNGDRRLTQYTDPGAHSFGVGQVPTEPGPVEKVLGFSMQPPDNPVKLVSRMENADGTVAFTDVAYRDGSRLEILDPPGGVENLLFVKRFDPAGALVLDKPVTGVAGPPPTVTPAPDLPPLEPQGAKVAASFAQAFALSGQVAGSFDSGVFSGDFSAEGTLGFTHSGSASLQVGPDGVDAGFSQQILLGAQGRLSGSLTTPVGSMSGSMSASAAMYASAVGGAHIGLDGIQASFSADAMIAAKAGVAAGGDFVFGSGHLGAEVGVGLGAHVDVDAEISTDRIGFNLGAGVGLGVLLGADADFSFSPSGLVDDIADDPVGTLGEIAATVGGRSTGSAGTFVLSGVLASATGAPGVVVVVAAEAIGEGLKAVGDTLEDVPVAGEIVGFIEDAGDVVDDAVHTVGKILPWNW